MTITTGRGQHTYELIQDCAKLPDGETFGVVSTVAIDSPDRVYVLQRKDPPVMLLHSNGHFLNSWENGDINALQGMTIAKDIVYITDREDSVAIRMVLSGHMHFFGMTRYIGGGSHGQVGR